MALEKMINISKDFSRFPAGRFVSDGDYSGEKFRAEFLVANLATTDRLIVDLDGTAGYGSSFLEEAFGGLVRKHGFSVQDIHKRLSIISLDKSLVDEVWEYIDAAKPDKG